MVLSSFRKSCQPAFNKLIWPQRFKETTDTSCFSHLTISYKSRATAIKLDEVYNLIIWSWIKILWKSCHNSFLVDWGPLRSELECRKARLKGDLNVETKETGQLAIALCHTCACLIQNKSFTYILCSFFFDRKHKAPTAILISKKLIPNPIQISAKSEQSDSYKKKGNTERMNRKIFLFSRPIPPFRRRLEVRDWRGLALMWQRFPFHSFPHLWIKKIYIYQKRWEARIINYGKHTYFCHWSKLN